MLFAEKDGVAGIWRIDGTPRRVTDGPAPEASVDPKSGAIVYTRRSDDTDIGLLRLVKR